MWSLSSNRSREIFCDIVFQILSLSSKNTRRLVEKLESKKDVKVKGERTEIRKKCDRSNVNEGIDGVESRKKKDSFDRTLNAATTIDSTWCTGAAIINYPRARREIAIQLDNVTELEHAKITVGFLFAARPFTFSVFFKSRFHLLF